MLKQKCLSNVFDDFIFDRKFKGLSPKTILFYQHELGYFKKWIIENHGDVDVTEITSIMIKKYCMKLSETRNGGGVYNSFTAIRALFIWSYNEYEIEGKNPIHKVNLPSIHLDPLDPIPLENVKKLIDSFEGKIRNQLICQMLIDGGFRSFELLSLRYSDIDANGQTIIRCGKGSKRRVVFLGKTTMKTYREYMASKKNINPEDYIFKGLKYHGLRQAIIRQWKRIDLFPYPLHSFRRTFAVTLFRGGVDLLTISRLLGHVSLTVTRKYIQIGNEDLLKSYRSPIDGL